MDEFYEFLVFDRNSRILTTQMAGSDADWDMPSKLYIVNGDKDSSPVPGVIHIQHSPNTKPETYDEVNAFVDKHSLNHGDVVRFGYYRDTDTVIVCRAVGSARMHFVLNPDDSGAGYLTIPVEVLANVRNGPRKYADVITSGMPTMNFHLGSHDEFIAETLGGQPPDGCQFDVLYVAGLIESICLKLPGSTRWREFDSCNITLELIRELLDEHNRSQGDQENAHLTLRVSLRGAQLTRYKDRFNRPAQGYAWLRAVPELPVSWTIEKGMSTAGSTSAAWIWKLQGPPRYLAEVKGIVDEFLHGFAFEYVAEDATLPGTP